MAKYYKSLMMKTLGNLFVVTFTLFFACSQPTPLPGYSAYKNGIFYKLEKIGENSQKAKVGDYITADLSYKNMDDSVFFNGRRKFKLEASSYEGSITECFLMLAREEKASFILKTKPFYRQFLQKEVPEHLLQNENFIIDIEIIEIQSPKNYLYEKEAFLTWIEGFNEYERTLLRRFLAGENMDLQPDSTGLYYIKIKEGNGNRVKKGDTLIVDFEGKFLNGKYFDSTIKRDEPFGFVYGQEWQVIKGLENGIGKMAEGEKAIFILPSELAFGKEGSSTGIIPPYTSLIYEVQLKEIRR